MLFVSETALVKFDRNLLALSNGNSLRMQDKAIAKTSFSPLSDSSSSIIFSNVFLTSIDIKSSLLCCVETRR
nr:MAG TPA: hypothetical protein [Caudoviricetes sp.]